MMEEILESGKADVIYMARELLADPFLPNKVIAGQEDKIVHCLRCFTCMAERPTTQTRRCAVNPLIGRECEGMDAAPVLRSKKVLIAGGGVAGLKAAVTAAQRGHQVILCEKSDAVGGILKSEQAIPFKHEMYE
jgi:NADPH-dependent 2,4-dienoyl-CoA reductase/sulfur reductase-like enzyme